MAKKMLRFGGPGLPEGTRTWYYDLTQRLEAPKGSPPEYAMVHVYPGAEVPADEVKDAADYVRRGMASYAGASAPKTETAG